MKKPKKEWWTVMAWNDDRIIVGKFLTNDPEFEASHMGATLNHEDDDPRWQAWRGCAAVEVLG